MRKTLMFVLMLTALTCSPLFSATSWENCESTLNPLAKKFLSLYVFQDELLKWEKKILSRIQQKLDDAQTSDEETAFQSIALDWFSSNGDKVKKMDMASVKGACMFFVFFFKMNFQPPVILKETILKEAGIIENVLFGMIKSKELENYVTLGVDQAFAK